MTALEDEARAIFDAAVRAVGADALIEDYKGWRVQRALQHYRKIRGVAMGKGALAMGSVTAHQLAAHGIALEEGLAVVPEGYPGTYPASLPALPSVFDVIEGGHPRPTADSVRAGTLALDMAEQSAEGDLLIVLISGGGTALCNAFAKDIPLKEVRRTFQLLLESGVDIHAMNAVRKHLSRVGGGQLARAAAPAETMALAISDVPGDDLSVIASGPTVPDPSTFADAENVVQENGLKEVLPDGVRTHLERGVAGTVGETPKPGDPVFERTHTELLGKNADAIRAARAAAERRGYDAEMKGVLEGEAREKGGQIARAAVRRARASGGRSGPWAWLSGGETTVTVRGDGTGGRNQELALAAAIVLEEVEAPVAFLSAGTDGIDGPTDAAGAVVTPRTAERIRAAGEDPQACLAKNDAHTALEAADALLHTGPTHTNVMDVAVVLIGRPSG